MLELEPICTERCACSRKAKLHTSGSKLLFSVGAHSHQSRLSTAPTKL